MSAGLVYSLCPQGHYMQYSLIVKFSNFGIIFWLYHVTQVDEFNNAFMKVYGVRPFLACTKGKKLKVIASYHWYYNYLYTVLHLHHYGHRRGGRKWRRRRSSICMKSVCVFTKIFQQWIVHHASPKEKLASPILPLCSCLLLDSPDADWLHFTL